MEFLLFFGLNRIFYFVVVDCFSVISWDSRVQIHLLMGCKDMVLESMLPSVVSFFSLTALGFLPFNKEVEFSPSLMLSATKALFMSVFLKNLIRWQVCQSILSLPSKFQIFPIVGARVSNDSFWILKIVFFWVFMWQWSIWSTKSLHSTAKYPTTDQSSEEIEICLTIN